MISLFPCNDLRDEYKLIKIKQFMDDGGKLYSMKEDCNLFPDLQQGYKLRSIWLYHDHKCLPMNWIGKVRSLNNFDTKEECDLLCLKGVSLRLTPYDLLGLDSMSINILCRRVDILTPPRFGSSLSSHRELKSLSGGAFASE